MINWMPECACTVNAADPSLPLLPLVSISGVF